MKARASFRIGKKLFMWTFGIMDVPEEPTTGFTSRVPGTNRHIIPLDYDLIRLDFLKDELRAVQREFDLGDFHMLRSRLDPEYTLYEVGGYHAICLDKVTLYELRMIQRASSCDAAFRWAPKHDPGRSWVLRGFEKGEREKPVYIGTLLSDSFRPQHLGTALFLVANYGVPLGFLQNSDDNTKMCVEGYLTAKRVKK